MRPLDRRSLLKGIAAGGATLAASATGASASEPEIPREDLVGMLYDATLCIGCKACMVACREANGVPYPEGTDLYDSPEYLSANAKTVIKLYEDGDERSYFKAQCMHCIDPACVAACMFGALKKRDDGIVSWNGDACVGCRYCEIGCPYNVPKFEWQSANPAIVKCEMCAHRIALGGIPACVEVCPRSAIIYGNREELLREARRRIATEPDRYYPKIYGEHDGGGTQVLYLSAVPFDKLGLPALGHEAVPELVRRVQGTIYKGFLAPLALYGILATAAARNLRRNGHGTAHEGDEATPEGDRS